MIVESVRMFIGLVDNRIRKIISKELVDEVTGKHYHSSEVYYQTYDKTGQIEPVKTHSIDKRA